MPTVAIIHFSGSGKTKLLAESIAKGARSVVDTTVHELAIRGNQIKEGRFDDEAFLTPLDSADAIIFGTPTYMGGVAAQFKAFADASGGRWYKQVWQNKLAGGFTTSGSASGDKQGTLLYLATFAAQHGMLWVGQTQPNGLYTGAAPEVATNRLGSFLGVMSQIAPTPEGVPTAGDRTTGEMYGARLATLVAKRS